MAQTTTVRGRSGQLVWRIARISLVVYLVVLLVFVAFENALLYFPTRYPSGDWTLASGVEDANFKAADGTNIHGWFYESPSPRAVVLFCHGNGGCIGNRSDMIDLFAALNVSTLMFDYRGYGRSEGSPNEAGVMSDGRAARSWLAKRCNIPENQIVLWGESLGGAVAVDLASSGARGLILQGTFSTLADTASFHYPWLPVRTCMRSRFDSMSRIREYHGPLLQFHGDADTIVPYRLGRKLFDAANEPKTFVTLPGADHNVAFGAEGYEAVDKFLASLAIPPNHPSEPKKSGALEL
jgi:fermentation-respiration switch protein FrsA (DUF1100 family)